jgi:phage recombination protein Bet
MSAVATRTQGTALTIQDGQTEFSPGQVATLRQLGVENATREDLAVFFHQAVRTGLDPFARQIYMIGRYAKGGMKQTIQTGIDGYRLIARRACDRSGETIGYEDTLWCGEDGKWTDVWLSKNPPAAAKVTVLRNGQPFSAVALFSEYAGTTKDGGYTQMWATKGAIMIAKCAEALALRKAFPQDLSGIYTSEEMAQADSQEEPQRQQSQHQRRAEKPSGSIASRLREAQSQPEPQEAPMEDLGEKPAARDFLAEAEAAEGDVDKLRAIWIDAKAANEPQEHLAVIQALVPTAAPEEGN